MRAALVLAAILGVGCAPERIKAPPAAPRVERPVETIPRDLDLVVRVDLARIRAALGETTASELALKARGQNIEGHDRGTELLVSEALTKTDTAWFAVRPGLAPESSDNVIVLRGKFLGLELRRAGSEPAWDLARDLGGDWRRYNRTKPERRSAPSRIYARSDELLVFVSEAEVDSVERTLEQRRGAPALEPPEKGALSLAVRLPTLVSQIGKRAPTLVKLLEGAERAEANADLTNDGLHIELAIEFDAEARATRVGEATRQLVSIGTHVEGRVGRLAKGLRVENSGSFVSARLELSAPDFAEILECGRNGCAW